MPGTNSNEAPIVDFSLAMKYEEKRQDFLDDVAKYKLPKEIEAYTAPLTRGERKEFKALIENADSSNDAFDEFVSTVLTSRGVDESMLDKCAYGDLMIIGKRLLLSVTDVGYIAKKK